MAGLQVFIMWASIFTAVTQYQGVTLSFKATEKTDTGWLVDLKYKSSFSDGYWNPLFWECFSGDCGVEINHWSQPVENRTSFPGPWYQYEGHIRRRVDNDKPFRLRERGCCWVPNIRYESWWYMTTTVDLGVRSDTQKPNSSPVTTIIPVIRIPKNCATSINLFGHDPDGDLVWCRYGYYWPECEMCNPYFYVDQKQCTLFIPSGISIGSYVMELILEDFPQNDIYVTYNDGTTYYKDRPNDLRSQELPKDSQKYTWYGAPSSDTEETFQGTGAVSNVSEEAATKVLTSIETKVHYHTMAEPLPDSTTTYSITEAVADLPATTSAFKETAQDILYKAVPSPYYPEWDIYQSPIPPTYTDPLSKNSLQFLVEVTDPAPSCTFGDYRPKFISPTPSQGEKLLTNVGRIFQLHLSAQAAYENISDFLVSGPPGITKSFTHTSRSTTRSMVAEWRPSENDVGDHVPFCFVAETSNGYQSEMRCVIVVVGPGSLGPGNTDLTCHENTMTLIAAKSSDHELYDNQFHLNDPKCLVSSNSTHLIASVAYNSCGTETEETDHDIVFKNQATSFRDNSSIISRVNGVSIPFNCSFPKKTRVSASFRAHKSDYVFSEAGFGNFTYKFQFYTDNLFEEVETEYPLEVTLQELLFMEIQVSSSVPNVQLFVESCKATPHDNPNDPTFYDIIQNGCIMDETFVAYSSTRTQYRFAMEAFAFIGDYSEVYMSCTVILCKLGEPGTRCTQGCITKSSGDSNRQRRSLSSESQQHYISQGPITMKRQSPSNTDEDKSPSLNVNPLVISLSGVIIVTLFGFIVYIYMKKARIAGYDDLEKTQDLAT